MGLKNGKEGDNDFINESGRCMEYWRIRNHRIILFIEVHYNYKEFLIDTYETKSA